MAALFFQSCSGSNPGGSSNDPALDSLLRRGIAFTQLLQFDSAFQDLNWVLQKSAEAGNTHFQTLAHINLGGLYFRYSADDKALDHFLAALDLATTAGEDELLNTIYNNIGIIYSENKSGEEALRYLNMALAISRKKMDKSRVGMNLVNLGNEYHVSGDLQKAKEAYVEAADLFRQVKDTSNWGITVHSQGSLLYEWQDYESALDKFWQAYELLQSTEALFYKSQVAFSLGKSYYQLGKTELARQYILAALPGFERSSSSEFAEEAYQWLSKISRQTGNMAEALEYLEKSMMWKDTLIVQKTGTWASEIQMNHQFQQKQKEIEMLHSEAKNQRLFWSIIIVSSTLVALLLLYLLRTKNKHLHHKNRLLEVEKNVDRLLLEKKENERIKLQNDIEASKKLNLLERKKLEQELEYKERVLAAQTLHMVTKNEAFGEILNILDSLENKNMKSLQEQLITVRRKIKATKRSDQDWKTFKLHFEEVHPEFFQFLTQKYPALGPNDLRMCAYLVLDLNSKEIAHVLSISPESVRKRKQRLKEKLGLESGHDLIHFLRDFRKANWLETKRLQNQPVQ